MSHFILKCSKCDKTISTCRCPSPDKTLKYDTCDECKNSKKPMKFKDLIDRYMEFSIETKENLLDMEVRVMQEHTKFGEIIQIESGLQDFTVSSKGYIILIGDELI